MTANKFTRNKDQFDSIESTYMHKLYTNQGKKNLLHGYSKGNGLPERKDKEILLQKVILRLINRGYLFRCDKMEFYKKNYLDNSHDKLILVIYPDKYDLDESIEWIIPFMEKVYDNILKQIALNDSIIVERAKGFKKIGLDIELYREICNTVEEFKSKLAELKVSGEIPENVLHKFYFTYENEFKIKSYAESNRL